MRYCASKSREKMQWNYRMLIVDDEALIAQGMQRSIERTQLFETEIASTGIEALNKVCAGNVDAMLLDINMPDMNGVNLLKMLNEQGKTVPTVIISGYEEFDYAKLAMRYGALDYLLKPVLPKDIAAIGLKLFEELEKRNLHERQSAELYQFVLSHRVAIKQKLLSDILNGSVERRQLEEIYRIYDVDLRGDYFTCAVFQIRRANAQLGELEFQVALRRVEEEIERVFVDVPEANLFHMENARYVLLIGATLPFESAFLENLLGQAADALGEIEGIEAFVGKGEEVQGLEHVCTSCRMAENAIDFRALFQSDRVFMIEDFRRDSRFTQIQRLLDELESQLRRMNWDGAETRIRMLSTLAEESTDFTGPQLALTAGRIACALMSVMLENGVMAAEMVVRDMLTSGVQTKERFLALLQRAGVVISTISMEITRAYRDRNFGVARKAAEYIRTHYADSALSVNRISQEINYSANYLGNAFKREYGESINDYISKYRIELAKKYLHETELRIYEIAFEVGFNDQHYFSKTFRRLMGVSPSEYRETLSPQDH